MQVIVRARAAGKTTDIVKLALDKGYDILVIHERERTRLLKSYPFLDKNQVFTLHTLASRKGRKSNGVVVDNAEMILQSLLDDPIKAISVTEE